jgi:hypothetical protein
MHCAFDFVFCAVFQGEALGELEKQVEGRSDENAASAREARSKN